MRRTELNNSLSGFFYTGPAVVILLLFHVVPIFYALYISLFNWRIRQGSFLGLRNYQAALTSIEFWTSLKVAVFYALGVVPTTLVLSFLIAYALHRELTARVVYRVVFFLPYVTALVAGSLVWRWIFHPQYGLMNFLLQAVGLPTQQWLLEPRGIFEILLGAAGVSIPEWAAGPSLALISIIIFGIWHKLGFCIVVFLAGLSNISPELLDAARVDGASEWSVVRYVTLRLLSPTLFLLMVVLTIDAFQSFSDIYVMTDPDHGGPLGTTRNITMYIYQNFFEFTRLGYACAVAILLFFLLFGLTALQMRVLGSRVHYK